jgi:hypothetical protein
MVMCISKTKCLRTHTVYNIFSLFFVTRNHNTESLCTNFFSSCRCIKHITSKKYRCISCITIHKYRHISCITSQATVMQLWDHKSQYLTDYQRCRCILFIPTTHKHKCISCITRHRCKCIPCITHQSCRCISQITCHIYRCSSCILSCTDTRVSHAAQITGIHASQTTDRCKYG